MLRGAEFCPTSMATGFLYAFMPLAGLGVLIVIAFKVTVALNAIIKASRQQLLPIDKFDLEAAGKSSAIQRSPSDSTLSKRYMAARAPPVTGFRSSPITPEATGFVSQFHGLPTPSSELSSFSEQEAFQLQLPVAIVEMPPQKTQLQLQVQEA